VKYSGTRLKVPLEESVQRRLFGLHARATRGPPPGEAPKGDEEEHWKAWSEAGDFSQLEAMQQYIDLIVKHDPDFLICGSDSEGDRPGNEMPPDVAATLAAAGYKQKSSGSADWASTGRRDIFELARGGAGSIGDLAARASREKDAVDADGLTPLLHAVDAECLEAVDVLLHARADVNTADPQRSTPLHYAALLGNEELVRRLLDARADPASQDEDGASPAEVARAEGHSELAELLG